MDILFFLMVFFFVAPLDFLYLLYKGIKTYIKLIIGCWLLGHKIKSAVLFAGGITGIIVSIFLIEFFFSCDFFFAWVVLGLCCNKKPIIYYYHY
jgi:hypothetical protein